ncbi:MAG: hypothetical protein ABSE51_18020 [Terracidiphilus sp.]|jgi:hypothetical protein
MTTTTIPFNKLLAWDGNVRKTEFASLAEREAARVRWISPMLRAQPSLPTPESIAMH